MYLMGNTKLNGAKNVGGGKEKRNDTKGQITVR